jgi:hypothetical protein
MGGFFVPFGEVALALKQAFQPYFIGPSLAF